MNSLYNVRAYRTLYDQENNQTNCIYSLPANQNFPNQSKQITVYNVKNKYQQQLNRVANATARKFCNYYEVFLGGRTVAQVRRRERRYSNR